MIAQRKFTRPASIEEAIKIAHRQRDGYCYVAGGTDVLVNKFQGNAEVGCLIDITGIEELSKITVEGEELKIGSLVRLEDLRKHAAIADKFPSLITAANEVASPLLRKTATIGGNIFCENRCSFYNQSAWWREAIGFCLKCDGSVCIATGGRNACFSRFVSDTAPVLISAGAKIELRDIDGTNIVDLEAIYTGDGISPRNVPATSILKHIILPLDTEYKIAFRKLRPRQAVDFTSLTVAVSLNKNGDVRVVLGGVDPKPVVVDGALYDGVAEFTRIALKKSRVVDNDYYSRTYRREMIGVFIEQCLEELLK